MCVVSADEPGWRVDELSVPRTRVSFHFVMFRSITDPGTDYARHEALEDCDHICPWLA